MVRSIAASDVRRLRIHDVPSGSGGGGFAEDVRCGLTASPKALPPKYFYDALGSKLFEAICELPEYYVTRAEAEIFTRHATAIVGALPGPVRLVELGSGDGQKTGLLLAALLERQETLDYLPIDISRPALEQSATRFVQAHPGLRIDAWRGEFEPCLRALRTEVPAPPGVRTLVCFLGSTLGNLDPAERIALLDVVRMTVRPGDAFLLGVDLRKSESVLIPAYQDPLGVTAAFNLNLLGRINRELGGGFDLAGFRHRARWNGGEGRIEMHLESLCQQAVAIRALDLEVQFVAGETVHTESSYKFETGQIEELAAASGFALHRAWTDGEQRFGSYLLAAV